MCGPTSDKSLSSSSSPLLSPTSKSQSVPFPRRSSEIIVKAATGFMWAVFGLLDFTISVASLFCNEKTTLDKRRRDFGRDVKTVVIVGGNFAGLAALRELQQWQKAHCENARLRIVLIDKRAYSEYTPGILRLFCEPEYFFRLAQALPEKDDGDACGLERIQGIVMSIVGGDPRERTTKVLSYIATGNGDNSVEATQPKKLSYDYLILATGATYNQPISTGNQTPASTTLLGRYEEWKRAHEQLTGSKSVLILGGGAVGVELAAEILDHDSDGRPSVTIVDARPTLVPLFPISVGAYAEEWLTQRGAILRLGESLRSWNDNSCTMKDGTVLHADIVYVCFGNRPNSDMVENGASNEKSNQLFSLTRRRNVVVKDTLQLVVCKDGLDGTCSDTPWFACGDVASPPSNDEKQAFQAEMQGKLAARNVIRLLESSHRGARNNYKPSLLRYPMDIAGAERIPLVYVLSLGRYDGVLGFNKFTLPGPLAAIIKWILEYTKVSQMRGRLLGNLIWKVGDAVTLFLSRTLLRPSPVAKALITKTNDTSALSETDNSSSDISANPTIRTSKTLGPDQGQNRTLEQQLKLS
mmetsp:Transcript_13018/g.32865  ORF Transcript_13018/g.32865 Transcript_13018/m.32865 type:complete len:582 (+) Transcript_13018:157-1902(+)